MNHTTCINNPLPTTVLKNGLTSIVPHISVIVNTSLDAGVVPPALKMATGHK